MNAPTVLPAWEHLQGDAAQRARVRLTRALRCERAYSAQMNARARRLARYTAHLGYVDLVALGLGAEARAIVARESRS